MKKDFIITNTGTAFDLEKATLDSIAACQLLDTIIDPVFDCYLCEGILKAYADRETNRDLDKAARAWMEEHFDELSAACYACRRLVQSVSDTLQELPTPTKMKSEEVLSNG